MRRVLLTLVIVLTFAAAARAQGSDAPETVSYLYAGGKTLPLVQVQDAAFYRIHADARVAATARAREPIDRVMEVFDVHNGAEQLAVRKSAELAAAARDAIGTLTRIKEADQLRVFTTEGGTTLLIEYPEIILQCDERATLDEIETYLKKHYQVTVRPTGLHAGQFLVRLATPEQTLWLANQLNSTTAIPVRYADVNFFFAQPSSSGNNPPRSPQRWPAPAASGLPNDPGFTDQWALENGGARTGAVRGADVGFARAFRIKPLDASGVKVAVLDYAIDVAHPELAPAIDSVFNATRYDTRKGMNDPALRQLDFDEQPEADADHGTACAGIIAALTANGVGVTGVAPGARIVAIQIARPGPSDVRIVQALVVVAALEAAQAAGADVVSLSWSLKLDSSVALQSVRSEIDLLNQRRSGKGIVMVAAAGNDTVRMLTPDFPADYAPSAPNLIAAGASNWCGERKQADRCDREPWSSRFDGHTLFAPGVDILTLSNQRDRTTPNALSNYRSNFNGTSAATPFIAGAAALVLKQHPGWTAAQVRDHLVQTAAKLKGGGQAELDICNAIYGTSRCAPAGGP